MEMTLEEATEIVRHDQNRYLRGELPAEELADVLSVYPNAAKEWNILKLNLKVRRKKLLKQAHAVLCVSVRKAENCKRFRPGKENSTLAKQKKKIRKIKLQFYRQGLDVFETFIEFMEIAARRSRLA
jgi:hypothetical protein